MPVSRSVRPRRRAGPGAAGVGPGHLPGGAGVVVQRGEARARSARRRQCPGRRRTTWPSGSSTRSSPAPSRPEPERERPGPPGHGRAGRAPRRLGPRAATATAPGRSSARIPWERRRVIRVLLVDDQQLVRTGLRRILTGARRLRCRGRVQRRRRGRGGRRGPPARSGDHGRPHEADGRRRGDAAPAQPSPTLPPVLDPDDVRRRRGPLRVVACRCLGLPAQGRAGRRPHPLRPHRGRGRGLARPHRHRPRARRLPVDHAGPERRRRGWPVSPSANARSWP